MDLDQETAKELVKSVIDGFEEESIVNAESVTLFLCSHPQRSRKTRLYPSL